MLYHAYEPALAGHIPNSPRHRMDGVRLLRGARSDVKKGPPRSNSESCRRQDLNLRPETVLLPAELRLHGLELIFNDFQQRKQPFFNAVSDLVPRIMRTRVPRHRAGPEISALSWPPPSQERKGIFVFSDGGYTVNPIARQSPAPAARSIAFQTAPGAPPRGNHGISSPAGARRATRG